MKTIRTLMIAIVLLAIIAGTIYAQSGNELFQKALVKERTEGNIAEAIKIYQTIVQKYGSDRKLVAKALLQMADCYQKLGDNESRKTYERLVREYSDQADAVAIARTRLDGALNSAKSMASRKVWTVPPGLGWDFATGATISADGRFLSFTDWDTGQLGLHELATGKDRHLTKTGYPNWAEESAISRDGKQVAYSWYKPDAGRYDLRIVPTESAGVPDSRVVFDSPDVRFLIPYDWSPDGNWIAVQLWQGDNARVPRAMGLGLISVRDGSLRTLSSSDWWGSSKVFFSPDGKYVGFDVPVGEDKDQRDVFVQDINGNRAVPVATGPNNDTMMGWSPDGKFLLFASNRGGSMSVWAVRILNGVPEGAPEMLATGVGGFSLGVTTSGSLYWTGGTSDRDVRIASVDFQTGKLLNGPVRPIQTFVGTNRQPAWSPDGKYLAYKSGRLGLGSAYLTNDVLGILSLETGQVRELRPKIGYFQNPRWTPDGQAITVYGKDFVNHRDGAFQIDLQTAEVKPIAASGNGVAPDGKHRYYRKELGPDGFAFVEQDLASGKEREILRRKDLGNMGLSPDGRFIATAVGNMGSTERTVLLISLAGGEPKELLRINQPPASAITPIWMPDGRGVLVRNETKTQTELLFVPIAGGESRKIDIGASRFEGVVQVNPDGRQIAYVTGEAKEELWVTENFLPVSQNRR